MLVSRNSDSLQLKIRWLPKSTFKTIICASHLLRSTLFQSQWTADVHEHDVRVVLSKQHLREQAAVLIAFKKSMAVELTFKALLPSLAAPAVMRREYQNGPASLSDLCCAHNEKTLTIRILPYQQHFSKKPSMKSREVLGRAAMAGLNPVILMLRSLLPSFRAFI